jgi:molecular chaperone DnaK
MGVRCGIDLGTIYSAIAWYDPGYHRAEAIGLEHADGLEKRLSAVYFDAEDHVVVGETAYRARTWRSDRVFTGEKRSLGLDFVATPGGTSYAPQVIAAEILKVLKADAERYLNNPVTEAVITVPTSFSEQQRLAVREAGGMAGLKVLELFPDPCAAALVKVDRTDTGSGTIGLNIMLLDDVGESSQLEGWSGTWRWQGWRCKKRGKNWDLPRLK